LGCAFEVSLPHITSFIHCGTRIKIFRSKMKISSVSKLQGKKLDMH